MGYVETLCQLCGVSFAIARLRNKHEPREAAWDYQGDGFVDVDNYVDINDECGSDTGCSFTDRAEGDGEEEREHIAGPGCITTTGYNGNRITVQEMKGCRVVQCLAEKEEGWQAEDDDQDFELESDYFLTGLGEGSPDVAPLDNIKPARHGVSEMWIYNLPIDMSGMPAIPFHPTCFEIFKKISRERLGKVDVEGLWFLREIEDFFDESPRDEATLNGHDQWWSHQAGYEYLAANPIEIPGLASLLRRRADGFGGTGVDRQPRGVINLQSDEGDRNEAQSQRISNAAAHDPFHKLSNEVAGFVVDNLGSRDIANLRLASMKFGQLPDILFRRLILEDVPWFWEASEYLHGEMCWFDLYWSVKFELGHLKGLVNRKRIWKMVEEIVRRIKKYRDERRVEKEKEKGRQGDREEQ